MPTCNPNNSIVSFPASIKSGTRLTQTIYDSIEEPLTADFKWGTRYTTPNFETGNKGRIDEVGHGGLNLTTLNFNNVVYNLYSVGIYSPSHSSWLVNNSAQNKEDLIFIFNKTNSGIKTAYDYVFLVIPLIEEQSNNAPSYLDGLANGGSAPSGGYSLSTCMPTDPQSQFAYYATCLSSTAHAGIVKSAMVLLSLDGINVSNAVMAAIRAAPGLGGRFSQISDAPVDPDINISSFIKSPGSILSGTDVVRYVLTSRAILDISRTQHFDWVKGGATTRDDSKSSYKCTQFDPEKDINKDGTITIDLASGQILNEVLQQRNVVINAMNDLSGGTANARSDIVAYLIGSVLGCLFMFAVVIAAYKYVATGPAPTLAAAGTAGTAAAVAATAATKTFVSGNLLYILGGILLILFGAIAGYFIAAKHTA